MLIRRASRVLLPVALFITFCALFSLFLDHPIVSAVSQKASGWMASSADGSHLPNASDTTLVTPVIPYLENEGEDLDGRIAPMLKASDLMSRPIATRLGTVPHIFHQSWIDSNLPRKFQGWSEGCRRNHHDYEYVLWTNEDNLKLVEKYYPWLLEAYNALPGDIYRADLVRNLYMYTFGGEVQSLFTETDVYADLDTDCLRSSSPIFEKYHIPHAPASEIADGIDVVVNRTAFFGRMGTDRSFEHSIPNAWMASTPGHPFFMLPIKSVIERLGNKKKLKQLPETVTGPIALRNAIIEYRQKYNFKLKPMNLDDDTKEKVEAGPFRYLSDHPKHTITLLEPDVIYPFSWHLDGGPYGQWCWVQSKTYDAAQCKKALNVEGKGSVTVTYWSHTHSPTGHNDNALSAINR